MSAGVSDSGQKVVFESALRALLESVRPGRAVLYFDGSIRAAHGLDPEIPLEGAPISLAVANRVLEKGQPLHCSQVSQDDELKDRFSLTLSQVRSLLCLPFVDPQGTVRGFLYADAGPQEKILARPELNLALELTHRLERILFHQQPQKLLGQPLVAAPPPKRRPSPRRLVARPSKKAQAPRAPLAEPFSLNSRSRMLLFRSLATMVGAGIPLHRALVHLTLSAESRELAHACEQMARVVESGQMLSAALRHDPDFPEFHQRLLQVGENSGSLTEVLGGLADYEERVRHQSYLLRSTLTYPAVLVVASLLVMLLVPPYLLQGQFEMIRNSGVEPPALTQFVMALSDLSQSPLFLLSLGSLVGLATFLVPYSLRRPKGRRWWFRLGLRLPVVGRLLFLLTAIRFDEALQVQLDSGLPLFQSLEGAGAATGNPYFGRSIGRVAESILNGQSLNRSLAETGWFDPTFLSLVQVGEETGRLPELLGWTAKLLEEELQVAIEVYTALVEPLVMLALGICVAILVVATLLPTITVLQSL